MRTVTGEGDRARIVSYILGARHLPKGVVKLKVVRSVGTHPKVQALSDLANNTNRSTAGLDDEGSIASPLVLELGRRPVENARLTQPAGL